MNNEEKRRRKIFFEFEQIYKNILYELQSKNDIECYDKVMNLYPNYPFIIYAQIRKFRQMIKIFVLTKVKSLRNINNQMIFIIL